MKPTAPAAATDPVQIVVRTQSGLARVFDEIEHILRRDGHAIRAGQALMLAAMRDGQTPGDLQREGVYALTNASYNISRLVEGGYITRENDPSDGRVARLTRTRKGQTIAAAVRAALPAVLASEAPGLTRAA